MRKLIFILCMYFIIFEVSTASAQGFVKFSNINGEVTIPEYDKWSEFTAVTQEISPTSTSAGVTLRQSSSPAIQNLAVVKPLDKASVKIAHAALTGKLIPEVIIEWASLSSNGNLVPFYSYLLKNVRVVSYNSRGTSHSENDTLTDNRIEEEIGLDFEEIKVTYWEYDSDGNPLGVVEYIWNK